MCIGRGGDKGSSPSGDTLCTNKKEVAGYKGARVVDLWEATGPRVVGISELPMYI